MIGYQSTTGAFSDREISRGADWFGRSDLSGRALSSRELAGGLEPEAWDRITHPERDAVNRQLDGLRRLSRDWDSFGAPAIAPMIIAMATRFLAQLLEHELERPAVVPTSRGGVAFEWHRPAREFAIELRPTSSQPEISVYFRDAMADEEWEAELNDLEGERLNEAFQRLIGG